MDVQPTASLDQLLHDLGPPGVVPRPGGASFRTILLDGFLDPMRGAERSHVKLYADTRGTKSVRRALTCGFRDSRRFS
jgi:hypothetical protein